ncbi:MAG: DNA-processing protein DprA [Opitutales bacterium]|nr:DNA-processing protein DprA [Opitutales bacterium]
MTDLAESYLRLSLIPNVGATTIKKLISKFGSPIDALKASRADVMSLERVGAKIADAFVEGRDKVDIDLAKRKLKAFNADYICIDDGRYPQLLRTIYDAPVGLYVAGSADLNSPSIAIVGCRNCSIYGSLVARKFGAGLGSLGLTVVSGLARGIDSCAHQGALDVKAKTVAVLGCGIDIVYPPENLDLYRRIIETGAVISEYPFGTRADRQTFPMRNRIIAGMTSATLLVESDIRGGGMITARLACDNGRDVFAVPGRIDSPTSAGCHLMISEGARLATCVEDIASELGYSGQFELGLKNSENPQKFNFEEGSIEASAYSVLSKGDALAADEISALAKLSMPEVLSAMLSLELSKAVKKRADGRWEKNI